MRPILLRNLTCDSRRGHVVLRIHPVGQEPIEVETDGNLGHFMSGCSVAFKEILSRVTGQPRPATQGLTGTIPLTKLSVERLHVVPWRWELTIESGKCSFTCRLDAELENLMNGLRAAMKFFAQKYGLVEVFPEVTRNRDRAGEAGLLEGHACNSSSGS